MDAHRCCRTSADAQPLNSSRTPSHPPSPAQLSSTAQAEQLPERNGWAVASKLLQALPIIAGNCQRPTPLQPTAHGAPAASHVKFGIPLRSANDARRCCRSLALPCRPSERQKTVTKGWPRRARHNQSLLGCSHHLLGTIHVCTPSAGFGQRRCAIRTRTLDEPAWLQQRRHRPGELTYRYRPGAQPCEVTPAPMPRQPAAGLCGLGPSDM